MVDLVEKYYLNHLKIISTVGADLFYVKQRTFEQRFDFKDYETLTGHINFGYKLPLGIESNISFGKYLAKDIGYTVDIGPF